MRWLQRPAQPDLEYANPASGEVVVDIGAGTGLLALALAEHEVDVWALDIASSMCDYLQTKALSAGAENVRVCNGSAVSLPFVDAFADLVVSNYCFHHLDDAIRGQAFDEIARILSRMWPGRTAARCEQR